MAGRVTKIINLTPHDVTVETDEITVTYPSKGVARVGMNYENDFTLNDIPVRRATYTEVTGLPDPGASRTGERIWYIVSTIVKNAQPGRTDLLVPDTGSAKRDEKGNIVSVPGFII